MLTFDYPATDVVVGGGAAVADDVKVAVGGGADELSQLHMLLLLLLLLLLFLFLFQMPS